MGYIFQQYLITFGWAITGAIGMGLSLAFLIKIFAWISPIDEWEEIKKGNMSAAVVMASVIVGGSLVIALTVMA